VEDPAHAAARAASESAANAPWRRLLESHDDDTKELVKLLSDKSPRLKAAAIEPEAVSARVALFCAYRLCLLYCTDLW